MSRVGYVCIEESFDTIFNIGCGGGVYSTPHPMDNGSRKSVMDERVNRGLNRGVWPTATGEDLVLHFRHWWVLSLRYEDGFEALSLQSLLSGPRELGVSGSGVVPPLPRPPPFLTAWPLVEELFLQLPWGNNEFIGKICFRNIPLSAL